jgi:ferredoxin
MKWRSSSAAQPAPTRLRLDPVACDGVGMCAHVAPALIGLDPWGFPLVPSESLGGRDRSAARRAVAGCPRRALFLEG